ncbi:organic cation transporter protein [Asbolus verrucosus]|uniref:Organic cation transporter protein n=1 Tax=Asbolus verrucosus TaxID=1661398 RepID=A0A482VF94_ASBVE|nr:organic cation transporter protein [Asbolus verrucosus]
MDFDDMLEELGELGKYQITTYILVCLPVFFGAANSLSYVFTAGIPNYRCLIPECEDPESTTYDVPWTKWAIPDESSSQILDSKSHLCDRFVANETASNGTCFRELFTNKIATCSEWVFDHSERTIVNDWNLTCFENQWKLSFVGTTHFAGIIVGSGLFGVLADRYGRKKIFIICTLIMGLSGIGQVVSPEYVTFDIMMFINAMGTAGVYPLAFIIGVEMVGKRKREITGIVLNYFYAIGEAVVAPIAWYTKDWVLLQLIVSAPAILFFVYYWIIPESVRWLLANKKREKAKGIVCRAAEVNNVTLSESLMDSFKKSFSDDKEDVPEEGTKLLFVMKTTLKSKKLVLRLLIIYFIWAVNAFVFYGLSVNSTSMSGNKYINFALVSLVEIPGYTLAWVSIQKVGRRLSLVGSLLLCGLTCTLTLFVPADMTWGVIVLFLTGKLGVTSAFGVVYVHTAEMLPTIIRSGGVGSASTMARFGALLAPFVPLLGNYVEPLPMLLFGGVAVAAGMLALKLPETLGIKLPETVEEAENL